MIGNKLIRTTAAIGTMFLAGCDDKDFTPDQRPQDKYNKRFDDTVEGYLVHTSSIKFGYGSRDYSQISKMYGKYSGKAERSYDFDQIMQSYDEYAGRVKNGKSNDSIKEFLKYIPGELESYIILVVNNEQVTVGGLAYQNEHLSGVVTLKNREALADFFNLAIAMQNSCTGTNKQIDKIDSLKGLDMSRVEIYTDGIYAASKEYFAKIKAGEADRNPEDFAKYFADKIKAEGIEFKVAYGDKEKAIKINDPETALKLMKAYNQIEELNKGSYCDYHNCFYYHHNVPANFFGLVTSLIQPEAQKAQSK